MIQQYGLIGYPLSHSFSGKYFCEKFTKENIQNCRYDLFEIESIEKVKDVFAKKNLKGFNVTIPYKHDIMAHMDNFDHSATKVGAVNVVKINPDGSKTGYNSDYYGFRTSLESWLPDQFNSGALILGIGGAAKAVLAVLKDLSIEYLKISRDKKKGHLDYAELKANPEIMGKHKLIINTTPLGMSPNITAKPDLNYQHMDKGFFLYDLIYNPSETLFLKEGIRKGAHAKNGLEMLELQAEKSWEIWNA